MSRKKKLMLNTGLGILRQLTTVVCGFILPRMILSYYGSDINGMVSSISEFLGFVTLLDLGVGSVVQTSLYKPLSENNIDQIHDIIASSQKFFKRIGYIYFVYVLILALGFSKISHNEYGLMFNATLVFALAISSLAQYFWGISYQLLLNADQKAYIPLAVQILTLIFSTIGASVTMTCGASIQIVKLVSSIIYIVRPAFLFCYARNHYGKCPRKKLNYEPIKQKWNGLAQHLASVINDRTDVFVLTIFSTLKNVSIYSVYYMVVYGVTSIIMQAAVGIEPMWGNMISKNENESLAKSFSTIEWIIHTLVTFLFALTAILVTPFVDVYTKGIGDVNYHVEVLGYLLSLSFGIQCLRIPYFRMIKAAGHYKQTQIGSIIQALINVILSIIFVKEWGIIGVAIGTLVSMLFHTTYVAIYLKNNILNRSLKYYFKHIIVDLIMVAFSMIVSQCFTLSKPSYGAWVVLALECSVVVVVVMVIINSLFYRKEMKTCVSQVFQKKKRKEA